MPKVCNQTDTEKVLDLDTQSENKIYCANCIHCKIVTSPAESTDQFYLRVRCDAGKWKKKLGEEKIHKYFTVSRRSIDFCDSYEDMGEPEEFMRDLRKNLPSRAMVSTSRRQVRTKAKLCQTRAKSHSRCTFVVLCKMKVTTSFPKVKPLPMLLLWRD